MVRRVLLYVGEPIHGDPETLTPKFYAETIPLQVSQISSAQKHLVLLTASGKVFTTGVGNMCQLGRELPESEDDAKYIITGSVKRRVYKLGEVVFPNDSKFIQVTCSTCTTGAINEYHQLYLWGFFNQQLIERPTLVSFNFDKPRVLNVSLGVSHCIAIVEDSTKDRNVYTWGISKLGGLGRESTESTTPTILDFFRKKDLHSVCAGPDSSAVIADSILYVFGDVEYLQSHYQSYEPRDVILELDGVKLVPECVNLIVHSVLVSSKNHLFGWGSGLMAILEDAGASQLPDITKEPSNRSTPLPKLFSITDNDDDEGLTITSITSCDQHIVLCTEKGDVFTWGIANNGKLANGNVKQHHALPTRVNVLSLYHPVISMAACLSGTYFLAIPPVCGVTLEYIMKFETTEVPKIIHDIITVLKKPVNCNSVGLFRLSGSSENIRYLLKCYDRDDPKIDLENEPVDDVAGLFKLFLRQLPKPYACIPFATQDKLREVMSEPILPIRYNMIYNIINSMPKNHFHLLKQCLLFLKLVVSNSEKNKMNLSNLVVCILPSIFGQDTMNDMQLASANGTLLSLLISNAHFWFGKYEELIPAQIGQVLEEPMFLKELSSLLLNLIKVVDPSQLQEIFISSGFVDKMIGRILSEEMNDENWRLLSDILLFILPLSADCASIINQLKIISKMQINTSTKFAVGNIFSFMCFIKTSKRFTEERNIVNNFILDLLIPSNDKKDNNEIIEKISAINVTSNSNNNNINDTNNNANNANNNNANNNNNNVNGNSTPKNNWIFKR